jgi:pimeloyl-ACP methyl ester carboxylesterase
LRSNRTPYPYPVHFLDLEMQGQTLRMAYIDVAPTGTANGQTIVLLHGKNFGSYYWKDTIRMLAAAGYRVVAPDQIGWGKSAKPDIRYSFQALAANTAHLLDTLGIGRVIVLGHSTGGRSGGAFHAKLRGSCQRADTGGSAGSGGLPSGGPAAER